MPKDVIISIARVLLSKNTAFCIYRFPDSDDFRLAIAPEYLPHPQEDTFWIAPFIRQSKAPDIFLSVVNKSFLNEDFLQKIKQLPVQKEITVALPAETTREAYFHEMQDFLQEIHSKKLEKAILSRVIYENKPKDFDPVSCFSELAQSYPNTFVHLSFHPQSGIWLGATPELLLRKKESDFYIMTLAGTQSRKEDGHYQWRPKEIEEHQMVGRHIEAVFEKKHCRLLFKDHLKTIESGNVAHLKTDYTFHEDTVLELKDLLSELHPTPAVGGLPVKSGIDCIRKYERYDRKYYCGFLGETNFSDDANLYVNLRCMQIGKDKIAVYVGGGITAASDPQEEWDETVWKSKTMINKIKLLKEEFL